MNTKKPTPCKEGEQFSDPKGALFMNLRDSLHQNENAVKAQSQHASDTFNFAVVPKGRSFHFLQFEFVLLCFDSEAWDTARNR